VSPAVSSPAGEVPALEVKDLHVAYGQVQAVRGVSLRVGEGKIVTLIGPNGAGKSTILAALCGLKRPDRGTVRLHGKEITGWPSHRLVAEGLTLVPEGRAILGRMSVRENLVLAGERKWEAKELGGAIDEQVRLFPILGERLDQLAGALSGGQQQMLAFARALLARPRVLLLDEPSMGLSPILVSQVFDTIREIHARGTTILLVEQNARLSLSVADDVYVLERGAIAVEGKAADLADDPRIRAAYLGG
jgi:branched-chain amino acid transport system ATP-binding protein